MFTSAATAYCCCCCCVLYQLHSTHIFYGGFGIYIPLLFCRYFGMPVSCLVLFVEMNGGPFGWLTMLTEREKTTLLTRFYTLSLLTVVVVLVIILRLLLLLMLLLLLLFMPALFEALLFFSAHFTADCSVLQWIYYGNFSSWMDH